MKNYYDGIIEGINRCINILDSYIEEDLDNEEIYKALKELFESKIYYYNESRKLGERYKLNTTYFNEDKDKGVN